MTRKVTGRVVAAVSLCAAVLVAGCQAVPDGSGTATSSASEPVPAAVSTTDVLAAVQAATVLQDLPPAITTEELLAAGATTPTSGRSRDAGRRWRSAGSTTSDRAPSVTRRATGPWH
ncbi:hypothetical protein O4159_11705 [Gordonia terrae]|uniref:hypothetical protein n=1 Tax=Gordonia hongkongensis TaxID=1701090 RepID=UPI0022B5394A|nr:hypothetical protein [Gordonia terrae]